jgi:hypothetical protein
MKNDSRMLLAFREGSQNPIRSQQEMNRRFIFRISRYRKIWSKLACTQALPKLKLRACSRTIASCCGIISWLDGVIPVAVEVVSV